jgi:hypothetical protein
MLVQFEDRTGLIEQMDMDIEEPCPVCCGMRLLIDASNEKSGFRCTSCSLVFDPVGGEDSA